MVSVLILTLNEESNLERCLESVAWSNDILVFDSFSSDRTVEIAKNFGTRVIQRRFDNYGAQREAARRLGRYKYSWVLSVDADEKPDEQLTTEVQDIARQSTVCRAFRMRRKDFFQGRWIKYSSLYPSWFIRFYQHEHVHYPDRTVHEYPLVHGSVGELAGHLLHDNFSKGPDAWWEKHKRYAQLEAEENLKSFRAGVFSCSAMLNRDPVKRRRALKELSMRFPFRPLLRFFYMYVLRRGFLDGRPGYDYCLLLAAYERRIVSNLNQSRQRLAPG